MASGCSLCASTGQCSTAYKNSPGQYCGIYELSAPCCCPLNTVCKVSPTQCLCHVNPAHNFPPNHHTYGPSEYQQYERDGSGGIIVLLLIVICCCLCCKRTNNQNDNHHCHGHHDERMPMATAYPATAVPIQTEETYPVHPSWGNPAFKEYGTNENRGGGAGAAIASGLGGLAAGALIGDMFGRNSAQASAPQFGGGYDIGGDSGGYDIAGDSGDAGGYDIQGDS